MSSTSQNRIEQKLFSSNYVEALFIDFKESKNLSKYELDIFPYEVKYPRGGTEIYLEEYPVLLAPEGNDKKDLENTKLIYETFKSLSPTQASDPRLWTYLTHVVYWNYMLKRWPIKGVKKPHNRIIQRYFLRRLNLESLTRNGLARLWWYGFLTYDEKRPNPWELTEVLLSRADLVVGVTERALGTNYNIRTAILEFLLENPEISKSEALTRKLLVKVNLIGGVKNLPFLDTPEIKEILAKVKAPSKIEV